MTAEEEQTIRQLAHSRTASVRTAERARIIWQAHQGQRVPAIATALGLNPNTVRGWLKRFNAQGLSGLADAPRSGPPPTYSREQVGTVVATALTNPKDLSLPFGAWTLDRLEAYLNEQRGIAIKRTRIDDVLRAEGLRWRRQETWFGKRPDPDFAAKRGPSKRSTPSPLRAV
jgi:transposase